jgi:hypothetical protein
VSLVREPARAQPKAAQPRKGHTKGRLRILPLEERIAPKIATNHNETLVRASAKAAPKAAEAGGQKKPKLQVVKLEERIAPQIPTNHNETLVRDRSGKAR